MGFILILYITSQFALSIPFDNLNVCQSVGKQLVSDNDRGWFYCVNHQTGQITKGDER